MEFLTTFSNWLWGWPLLSLIIVGGLIICFRTRFFHLTHFPYVMQQTIGQVFSSKQHGEGQLSPFQAMTTALASSIGAANIVVAPAIIFTSGPGAIFWMVLVSLIGQATKFAEVTLSMNYREKNEDGEYVSGASYVLKKGIGGTLGKVLGTLVSFFFMIEILPSITLQSISASEPIMTIGQTFGADPQVVKYIAIAAIFILTALVTYGGVKAIGETTSFLVPIMAVAYIVLGLVVLVMNAEQLPNVVRYIFVGAFNPKAFAGGFAGATIQRVIGDGVARGVYSSEAGMGSAGYGHAAAATDHPVRQGLWGCFEVLADTMVLLMSTLVVLAAGIWTPGMSDAALQASASNAVDRAFNDSFGVFGSVMVSIFLFLFVISTLIVIVFYCEKQAEYLFGTRIYKIFRALAMFMIILGAFVSFEGAGTFLDITLGLVIIPNMIGVIMLSGKVKSLTNEFFSNPTYYPKTSKKK